MKVIKCCKEQQLFTQFFSLSPDFPAVMWLAIKNAVVTSTAQSLWLLALCPSGFHPGISLPCSMLIYVSLGLWGICETLPALN